MDPNLDAFSIFLLVSFGGAIGGTAEYLRQIAYRNRVWVTNSDEVSSVPVMLLLLASAIIGLSGAIAIQFIFVLLGSFSAANTAKNIVFLFSISVAAGFGARIILPRLTERLKKQIEGTDQKATKADQKAMAATDEVREARFVIHLNHALSPNATESERQEAIEQLTARVPSDPTSRLNTILLARLYRARKNYKSAIRVLDNFLQRKEQKGERDDKDYADVLYNKACYYALSYGETDEPAKKEEYKQAVLESLARSSEISEENKIDARTDSDFDPLRGDGEFTALIE